MGTKLKLIDANTAAVTLDIHPATLRRVRRNHPHLLPIAKRTGSRIYFRASDVRSTTRVLREARQITPRAGEDRVAKAINLIKARAVLALAHNKVKGGKHGTSAG